MSLIMSMQHPLGIPPSLRENIDYIFIFKETNNSTKRRIYDNYLGFIGTFEMFNEIIDRLNSNNFECLVIDRYRQTISIYVAKNANEHEPFLSLTNHEYVLK